MTNYATQPLEILNADLNAAKEGVDSLSNYYDKTETYSKVEVDGELSSYATTDSLTAYATTDSLTSYATKSELSDVVGDINSILDAINGEII